MHSSVTREESGAYTFSETYPTTENTVRVTGHPTEVNLRRRNTNLY